MMRSRPGASNGFSPLLLTTTVLLSFCAASLADGYYEGENFTLRFPAALTRFATYGDVAGVGGASAGSPWSSSTNPASTAWRDIEGTLQTYVSTQYTHLWFDHGARFGVLAESLTIDADEWGTFTLAAAQIKTNQARMNSPYDYYWGGDLVQLLWAKKLTDDWALGFSGSWTKSTVRNDLDGIPIDKANSDSYAIRAGTLHRIAKKWLGGLVLDYGWSRDRTCYHAVPALGLSQTHVYDKTRQFLVRPGVSFEYMKDCFVYLDYQYGVFWNDTGSMKVHRIFTGVEHGLNEWIFARAGTTFDPYIGSWAWTCGLGFYPAKWFSLDVAYQYDMFPEIITDFGRSQTLNVSASITF